MAPPQTSDAFLEVVRKSGLVPRGRIALLTAREPAASATDMARALIAQGDITNFQAARLLEGAFRGFFIEQYKVLDVVGGGGMGLLYLAEHRETRERVALKVLAEVYKHDTAMRARFELEAKSAMRLNHPNIVRMFELGYTDDLYDKVPYMAMEFVKGLELQELAVQMQGPIQSPQACDLIRQVAAGLHHAHELGLVHRDVKPTNLLIDETGNAKLLDFGLALAQHGDQEDELSLSLIFGQGCVGTDDFISPEQTYNSSAVDRRADIYSLGCTLYFALTGRVPFPNGPSTRKIEAHRKQQPRPLRELMPRLPEGLTAIVEKMMAKEPDQRFETAAEVEAALAPFAKHQPVKFDFAALLAARRKVIKQRAIAQGSRFARPSTVTRSGTNRTDPKTASGAETIVNKDTQREQPAPYSPPQSGSSGSSSGTVRRSPSVPTELPLPTEPVSQAYLIPADGGRIMLRKARVSIGRASDCDIRLPSPGVGAKHCELYFTGTDWRIFSLERSGDVLINGSANHDSRLRSGDKLTIAGQYHFRFEFDGDTAGWTGGVKLRWIAAALGIAALLLVCCWWLV